MSYLKRSSLRRRWRRSSDALSEEEEYEERPRQSNSLGEAAWPTSDITTSVKGNSGYQALLWVWAFIFVVGVFGFATNSHPAFLVMLVVGGALFLPTLLLGSAATHLSNTNSAEAQEEPQEKTEEEGTPDSEEEKAS